MTDEFYNKVDAIELTEAERNAAIEEALWCAKLKKTLTPGRNRYRPLVEATIRLQEATPTTLVTREWALEHKAYRNARYRCTNKNSPDYKNYGGRGIEFRFTSFAEFIAELGRRPSPKHSINRIDNDGHYEKGNVEWATAAVQSANRRRRRVA